MPYRSSFALAATNGQAR